MYHTQGEAIRQMSILERPRKGPCRILIFSRSMLAEQGEYTEVETQLNLFGLKMKSDYC